MRTVTVPDFGDSGALYLQAQVPEPGDPGYTGVRLPESDPWAKYVNPVMDMAEDYAEYQAWAETAGREPEAATERQAEIEAGA